METIFDELVYSYQNYRLFTVAHDLFLNEAETFVENVRQRITQLQAEHDSRIAELENTRGGIDTPAAKETAAAELAELRAFPARVVDCEISAFESIADTIRESAAEGYKHRMTFCDAFAAASAELERIRACYSTDSRKASRYAETFENIKESWDQMILGKEPAENESF